MHNQREQKFFRNFPARKEKGALPRWLVQVRFYGMSVCPANFVS